MKQDGKSDENDGAQGVHFPSAKEDVMHRSGITHEKHVQIQMSNA